MADREKSSSKKDAPDPSDCYERSHPEKEAGMGKLDSDVKIPTNEKDRTGDAVANKQNPTHQINGQDVVDSKA